MSGPNISNQGQQYSTVTMEQWKKGSKSNNCVWNALKNAGYSNKEIAEQNLVDQVAKENKLEDPNKVSVGQELRIPVKVKDKRESGEVPSKSDPHASQGFVDVQSDVSKHVTGEKSHGPEGHGEGGHGKHVEAGFHTSTHAGPVELEAHGKAEAGTHTESGSHAHFEANEKGIKADAGAHAKAGAEAGAEIEGKVKVGDVEVSGHGKAEAKAEADAEAGAHFSANKDGLKAGYHANAQAEAEAKVEAGGKVKVGDAEAGAGVFAEAKAKADAGVKSELEISKDKVKIQQGARAGAEAEAVVGAEGEIKTKEGHIKAKYETGVEALAEAEASGRFEVGKDGLDIGFRTAARAEAGHIQRVKVDAKTEAGSGIDATVKVGEGADIGGVLGGGLKVDKTGVRAEVEIGGALGLEGHLKVGASFKYEDMKKPEFIAGSMIGGPIGGVAAVMARPYVEKAGEAISDGAGYVKDKAVEYGSAIKDGAVSAYNTTSNAIGGTVSTISDGAKSIWKSIWD